MHAVGIASRDRGEMTMDTLGTIPFAIFEGGRILRFQRTGTARSCNGGRASPNGGIGVPCMQHRQRPRCPRDLHRQRLLRDATASFEASGERARQRCPFICAPRWTPASEERGA